MKRNLLLLSFVLVVVLFHLFSEEVVISCQARCYERYNAYYQDCMIAYWNDWDKLRECNKVIDSMIADCTIDCGSEI